VGAGRQRDAVSGWLSRGRRRPIGCVLLVLVTLGCASSSPPPHDLATRYVRGNGVRLHVTAQGSGAQVVVLVHGGPGLSLQEMSPLTSLTSPARTIISYDQRGAGSSTADGDYSISAQVADLEAIRQAFTAQRVWLVGQSWGGLVAAAYAAAHPSSTAGLVLIGALPPDLNAFLAGQRLFSGRLQQLQSRGVVPTHLPADTGGSCLPALSALAPVYAADPSHPVAEPQGTSCTAATAAATYRTAIDQHILNGISLGLAAYVGPALILTGAEDPFGPTWPAAWKSAIPQASLHTVVGAGHNPTLEKRSAVITLIEQQLRAVAP
jgi:pimeloyl-ACP methyl ester carboxylesterase